MIATGLATATQGLNCQKISGGVDICLFIVTVITHRQFSIINNGGGGVETDPPGYPRGILFGGLSKQLGGFNPPTPPAIQTLPPRSCLVLVSVGTLY
jgi:hypothetical protein